MRRSLLLQILFVVCGLFLLDALLFRTGWYAQRIHPDSSAGHYERLIRHEIEESGKGKRVLVLGDSRTGFLARVADEHAAGRIRFANAALGGTTPRCWYYLLREMDPQATNYAAIFIPFDLYEDEENTEDLRNRTGDLKFLAVRLRLADTPEFLASVSSLQAHVQTTRAFLWKGVLYSRDLQDLLSSPARRSRAIETYRNWAEWVYGFRGDTRSLDGLAVDYQRRTIRYPDTLPQPARDELRAALLWEPKRPAGWMYEYRRQWISRIAARYRSTQTKLIFFRLPRGPVPRPTEWIRSRTSAARELASHYGIRLIREDYFSSLERPHFFFDPMHLNGAGMEHFSEKIAQLAGEQGL